MKQEISFRKAWNEYNTQASGNLPKNVTKEYAFILKCHYVLGRAIKDNLLVKDELQVMARLADMEENNIPLNFARLMIELEKGKV